MEHNLADIDMQLQIEATFTSLKLDIATNHVKGHQDKETHTEDKHQKKQTEEINTTEKTDMASKIKHTSRSSSYSSMLPTLYDDNVHAVLHASRGKAVPIYKQ
eukprot:5246997-Ditylum_brightwellii.AAC.1